MFQRLLQWIRQVIGQMLPKQNIQQATGTKVAVSEKMAEAIDQWFDIFEKREPWAGKERRPMRLAVFSTAYLSRLVNAELKLQVNGSPRAEFIQEQLERGLLPDIDEKTQLAMVGGQVIWKPIVTGGQIAVETVRADCFFPTEFDFTKRPTAGIFVEQRGQGDSVLTRLEYHRLENDKTYTIQNTAYRGSGGQLGRSIPLTSVEDWADIQPEVRISGIERPLFAAFRMPAANNIDPTSPLPISLYANAIDTLEEMDHIWGDYCWEFHSGRRKLIVDETSFQKDREGRRVYPNPDLYVGMNFGKDLEHPYGDYSPTIREEQFRSGINQQLRIYEAQTGVSPGTYSFDTKTGAVTATQVVSEDRATFWTVGAIQRKLKAAFEDLIYAMDALATLYHLTPPGKVESTIEFGDSVFEDTNSEYIRRSQMVTLGAYSLWELRSWYFGESEETAKKMVAENPIPDDLMGYFKRTNP